MSWGGPFFVLAIIGMSFAAWIVTTWIRARHGYPVEGEWGSMVGKTDLESSRKVELLEAENGKLLGQVSRLEERIAVLERIATDRPRRLADEIDSLR
jgi:hypothetical protein